MSRKANVSNPEVEHNGQADPLLDPASLEITNEDTGPDPFDPEALRVAPPDMDGASVKRAILKVAVRRPDRTHFVRVRSEPEFRIVTGLIELPDERDEVYLVAPALRSELEGVEPAYAVKTLFTTVNRQGDLFLWPVKSPDSTGKIDDWNRTARLAAEHCMVKWARVIANRSNGGYELRIATGTIPPPEWPELEFRQILKLAFGERYIAAMDHPILQKLRGE